MKCELRISLERWSSTGYMQYYAQPCNSAYTMKSNLLSAEEITNHLFDVVGTNHN